MVLISMKKILLSLFTIIALLMLSVVSIQINTVEAASSRHSHSKSHQHKKSQYKHHHRSKKRKSKKRRKGRGGCQTLSSATLHRKARPYNDSIHSAAKKYGINANLIKAIITIESCFKSRARGSLGEKGLMQLMPQTARRLNVKNGYNPYQNVHGGSKYLRYLLNRYNGNMTKAIAAYNAGAGRIDKGKIPNRRYVNKVLHAYRKFSSSKAASNYTVKKKLPNTQKTLKPITQYNSYKVKSGDTVYEVMRKTGIPVKRIIALNSLRPPYQLKVGQHLQLKGQPTTQSSITKAKHPVADVYIVESNDTLYSIMRQTGVPIEKIVRLNQIPVPYSISKGQEIRLR